MTTAATPDAVTDLVLRVAHQLHDKDDKKSAADLILQVKSANAQTTSEAEAIQILVTFRQWLLDQGRYADTAALRRYLVDDLPFFWLVLKQRLGRYKNPWEGAK